MRPIQFDNLEQKGISASPRILAAVKKWMRDQGLEPEEADAAFRTEVRRAIDARYGTEYDIRYRLEQNGSLRLFQILSVASVVSDDARQISSKNAAKLDPGLVEGDEIAFPMAYDGLKTPFGELSSVSVRLANAELERSEISE